MAQWLQVSKSGYYAWRKRPKSDITYIPTEEGWLYLAGVMDLCGNKIVGVSMDGSMTKDLVISALKDAIHRLRRDEPYILTGETSTVHWIIRHLQKSMDLSAA